MLSLFFVLALAIAPIFRQRCYAQDELILRRTLPSGQKQETRRTGTILDYKAGIWTLRSASGKEDSFENALVVHIQTLRGETHRRANALFELGQAREALAAYQKAHQEESRVWMKRIILTSWVRCLQAVGEIEQAGDTFLHFVLAADPNTPDIDALPLAWYAQLPDIRTEQKAAKWLNEKSEAAKLLGASWLLNTGSNDEAMQTLRALGQSNDRRIALLADLQIWRRSVATADAQMLAIWKQQIKKFPSRLQYGAWFQIASVEYRLGMHKEAALDFMKIPILHKPQLDLSSQALVGAAKSLGKLNQPDRAAQLLRQTLRRYPDTRAARDARSELNKLQSPPKKP